jgi:hypothetical protein
MFVPNMKSRFMIDPSIVKMKTFKSLTTSMYYGKVDWLVIEHLSAQGRSDSRGGLHCLWCPNKTWTLPLGTSDTLTIFKNEFKKKKVMAPQNKEGQELK